MAQAEVPELVPAFAVRSDRLPASCSVLAEPQVLARGEQATGVRAFEG